MFETGKCKRNLQSTDRRQAGQCGRCMHTRTVLIYNSKIRGIVLIQEPTLHTTSFYRNTGQDLALADIQMAKEQHWGPRSNLGRRIFIAFNDYFHISFYSDYLLFGRRARKGAVNMRCCSWSWGVVPSFPPHCACFIREVSVPFPIHPPLPQSPRGCRSLSPCTVARRTMAGDSPEGRA